MDVFILIMTVIFPEGGTWEKGVGTIDREKMCAIVAERLTSHPETPENVSFSCLKVVRV